MSAPTPHFPTVVIVPGAFHTDWHFKPLCTELHALGFETQALHLPTVATSPSPSSYDQDVATIKSAITNLVDQGQDVVLLMHSYGGIPGTEAACGFGASSSSSSSSQQSGGGKPRGRVLKLVYIASFMLPENMTIAAVPVAEPLPRIFKLDEQNPAVILADDPADAFFHDVPGPLRDEAVKELWPMGVAIATAAPKTCAWREIPTAYVVCGEDRAVPVAAQDMLVRMVRDQGVEVEEVRLDGCSHSPFLSMPKRLAGVVKGIVC